MKNRAGFESGQGLEEEALSLEARNDRALDSALQEAIGSERFYPVPGVAGKSEAQTACWVDRSTGDILVFSKRGLSKSVSTGAEQVWLHMSLTSGIGDGYPKIENIVFEEGAEEKLKGSAAAELGRAFRNYNLRHGYYAGPEKESGQL